MKKKIPTEETISKMKEASRIASKLLDELISLVKPGINGSELNLIAKKRMDEEEVISSCYGYNGFPAYICISRNHCLTHGIPDENPFSEGDLISIDLAISYQGYHGDNAKTILIPSSKDEKKSAKLELLKVTEGSLYFALSSIKPNLTTTQELGATIERYVRSRGYYPIKEYGGHGIGKSLHEEPFIPNYRTLEKGTVLKTGMFICVEPLVQVADSNISLSKKDGWSVFSTNGNLNAHFEHTIYINENNVEILT